MPGNSDAMLEGLDEVQKKLMEEECILVDENDRATGSASKKICHLLENIDKGMLHRAFSVFLFNTKGELLLQQRSPAKITFPTELDEQECIGVRRAAQRKLKQELGIEAEQVPLNDFQYLTRIQYKSSNVPHDGTWGEHEIDYILFIQRDVTLRPNDNEVMDHRFVSQEELKAMIDESKVNGMTLITPWFQLIVDNFLYKWWSKLDDLSSCKDHDTIHRM